ncbi:MAG: dTDP-4-dehydrorhamnose reductase [Hyphomonadaceae bacterium]|nr:dTDP-4-dehydrorhamnose reductase [Hyphomonadaceae bacterium]
MKLAIFGKSGQLSRALQRQLNAGPHTAMYFDRNACNLASDPADIYEFACDMLEVDVVVLAAAYTGVEQAEDDQETAFAVNAKAPEVIADVCARRDIPLIYISTDYVFDGEMQSPYQPDYPANPLNVYGRSKLAGENAILERQCEAVVLRTSWLFDGNGRNFMTAMLKMEENGKRIRVIGDQIGRPTYVGHLADAVLKVASRLNNKNESKTGVYHVTNTGDPVSWAGFAREIFKKSGTQLSAPVIIDEILTEEYAKRVARPAYSVLDTSSFEKTFGLTLPDWRDGLDLALAEWRQH